ncbi:peptidase M23 [Lactococcus insecticola]|uniref:Peptidase M23 n=2 Tax=Pseudolactococcus insecticola TaxID=2709158 RepID=A0A6A0B6S7_9LACT|nr:LysM peptidoglycan-binding domain-containing protein [Lactococcus insecticola]GFH41050.1 peptidase M23 [Lactococcus insecticola]
MKTYKHDELKALTKKMSTKNIALVAGTLIAGGIFASGNATLASADQVTYTVKPGDTLSQISEQFFNDDSHVQAIATANHIDNLSLIQVGQAITIDTDATVASENATNTTETATADVVPTQTTETTADSYATPNGFSASSAKEAIAMTESGGSYTAQNGQYYGRYQLSASYLGGDYSAANQERVADNYVAQRYGSWEAAWAFHQANGWY